MAGAYSMGKKLKILPAIMSAIQCPSFDSVAAIKYPGKKKQPRRKKVLFFLTIPSEKGSLGTRNVKASSHLACKQKRGIGVHSFSPLPDRPGPQSEE